MPKTFDVAYLSKNQGTYFQFKIKGEEKWTFYTSKLDTCLEWYESGDSHGVAQLGFTIRVPGEFL